MTVWQVAALQLLEVYLAARLFEVLASRIRARAARTRPAPEPWFWMIAVVHAAVLFGSAALVLGRGSIPPRPLLYGAAAVLVVAIVLRGWVLITLRGRWNIHVIDPGEVATGGPYRFVRHPNYLAVILEVAALPLAVGAYEVAVLGSIANAIVLSWRIPFEEQQLARRHPEYRDVIMRRPRLLPIPRRPG